MSPQVESISTGFEFLNNSSDYEGFIKALEQAVSTIGVKESSRRMVLFVDRFNDALTRAGLLDGTGVLDTLHDELSALKEDGYSKQFTTLVEKAGRFILSEGKVALPFIETALDRSLIPERELAASAVA